MSEVWTVLAGFPMEGYGFHSVHATEDGALAAAARAFWKHWGEDGWRLLWFRTETGWIAKELMPPKALHDWENRWRFSHDVWLVDRREVAP